MDYVGVPYIPSNAARRSWDHWSEFPGKPNDGWLGL